MPRSARQQSVSDHYHVTQRGSGKRCIFEDDDDRRSFVRTMAYFSRDCQVRLIAWVLMDNHFHLLLRAELEDLSRFMSRLGTVHAQRFNGAHGHVGCVFQGRFKSIPIETDPQLLATIRYIHLNPLETGVTRLEDYPWSSYPQYLGSGFEALASLGGVGRADKEADRFRKRHRSAGLHPETPLTVTDRICRGRSRSHKARTIPGCAKGTPQIAPAR